MADMSARQNHGRWVSSAELLARMSTTASYALRRLMIYLYNTKGKQCGAMGDYGCSRVILGGLEVQGLGKEPPGVLTGWGA